MSSSEVTEKLIGNKQEPKKKNKKLFIVIGAIALVLLIGGCVYGYMKYSNQKEYQKNLDIGYKNLEEQNYDAAIIAFQDAIKISDKSEEPYLGLTQAAIYVSDNSLLEESYQNLYRITGNEYFKNLGQQVGSGNEISNIANSGQVLQQGNITYIVDNNLEEEMSYIWKVQGDEQEILFSHPFYTDQYLNAYDGIKDLNFYETKLYFLIGTSIYAVDINTGYTEDSYSLGLSSYYANELLVYNDRLYISGADKKSQGGGYDLISCDLNGNNSQHLITGGGRSVTSFIFHEDMIYLTSSPLNATSSTILRCPLSDPASIQTL